VTGGVRAAGLGAAEASASLLGTSPGRRMGAAWGIGEGGGPVRVPRWRRARWSGGAQSGRGRGHGPAGRDVVRGLRQRWRGAGCGLVTGAGGEVGKRVGGAEEEGRLWGSAGGAGPPGREGGTGVGGVGTGVPEGGGRVWAGAGVRRGP